MKLKKFKVKIESKGRMMCSRDCTRDFPETIEEKKDPEAYDSRIWRERAYFRDGEVIIPGSMVQASLMNATILLGERIGGGKQGKGLKQVMKLVRITGEIRTGIKRKNLKPELKMVPHNATTGAYKVPRRFPIIPKYKGTLIITYPNVQGLSRKKIIEYLNNAGEVSGLGAFAPRSGGDNGRFIAKALGGNNDK